MLLQEMWQLKLEWDESLPQEIHQRWVEFKNQLTCLTEIRIPRGVKKAGASEMELHGFCDASERAYGACVYVRTGGRSGRPRVALLASKSRVAPVRAVSLPRLELSAAKLLAELTQKIRIAIGDRQCKQFLWTDSMVALHWIVSSSRKWNAFVANRVGEIQRITEIASWRHVPSAENPADILSRGRALKDLAHDSLWWTGSKFLRLPAGQWPTTRATDTAGIEIPERKNIVTATANIKTCIVHKLMQRISSITKIARIVAYCMRFKRNRRDCGGKTIRPGELKVALIIIVRCVQRVEFADEYAALAEERALPSSSHILSLTPFINEFGVIRVGGRLRNLEIPYEVQQPGLGPLMWTLGRVIQTHPGSDGIVRAATLKTKGGTVTRPTVKLAVLLFDGNTQTDAR
ncbi:hypothetical protein PUN28_008485 [Cardiocondyla obscurior]|uniref:DUF5641 domain-containing protein n=2 Tax=Cardiocondyla obscurior TaxID=286306 RepID=A0AAW2G3Z5_9HYME